MALSLKRVIKHMSEIINNHIHCLVLHCAQNHCIFRTEVNNT